MAEWSKACDSKSLLLWRRRFKSCHCRTFISLSTSILFLCLFYSTLLYILLLLLFYILSILFISSLLYISIWLFIYIYIFIFLCLYLYLYSYVYIYILMFIFIFLCLFYMTTIDTIFLLYYSSRILLTILDTILVFLLSISFKVIARVAEWSKASVSGTDLFGGVGSNPTSCTF